ncbi:MAG: YbaK/EbsC family protein [Gammaproteobacteria bacterium]|nr:YbaK/EbsC family protein [Gammaproteobacteria bacterium]
MGIAITLKEFFEDHGIEVEAIEHPRTASSLMTSEAAHVPGDRMVKAVLLGDDEGYVLALIPATHRLEIEKLDILLGRKLSLISEDEVASAFSDCETGSIPPLGDVYGVETWIDSSLWEQSEVFFESGDHAVLIRMMGTKFRELLGVKTPVNMSYHL